MQIMALSAASSATASIIGITNQPFTVQFGPAGFSMTQGSYNGGWDIDLDGTADFSFGSVKNGTTGVNYVNFVLYGRGNYTLTYKDEFTITRRSYKGLIGGAVENEIVTMHLGQSYTINATGGNGVHLDYNWFTSRSEDLINDTVNDTRWLVLSTGTNNSAVYSIPGFSDNFIDNLREHKVFGFRFKADGAAHAGWGRLALDVLNPHDFQNSSMTINISEWYYNSTPNGNITVGAVPEPRHIGSGLGLLALGVAGLRHWRKTRNKSN